MEKKDMIGNSGYNSFDAYHEIMPPEIHVPPAEHERKILLSSEDMRTSGIKKDEAAKYHASPLPTEGNSVGAGKKNTGFLRRTAAAVLIAVVAGGSIGLGAGAGSTLIEKLFTSAAPTDNVSESLELPTAERYDKPQIETIFTASNAALPSVSDVYKKVADSVVSISVTVEVQSYFGGRISEQPGSGSGIIFAEDSGKVYIVTNYHVIDGANKVSVSIDDNHTVAANYVGGDKENDIAIISALKSDFAEIGVKNIKIAQLGNSDAVQVGDAAIAVGNALGAGKIATYGIISAVGKSVTIDGKEMEFIQTDAAINPGNSGGPLVNGSGEVIAINTAKISGASYGIEGIGFSIPSNIVKEIADEIMRTGSVVRPYIGVSTWEVTEELKEWYSLPSLGLYVEEVSAGSGAEKGGVRAGDIIVALNDVEILKYDDLITEISNSKIGEIVDLTVVRSVRSGYGMSSLRTEELVLKIEILDMNAPKF